MAISQSSQPRALRSRGAWRSIRLPFGLSWTAVSLAAIVVLAAALRFGNLAAIGESNTYYTAAVKSMLQSWHNFFFVAAEPGGSVSVDKPPVGLWLQAISAYFLGVSGFATVLPNLLAGLGAVVLVFWLVRRWFGDAAGLLAALALAVTPVAIAVERNNTPDATLIFTLLLATWAFMTATETGRLRWLVTGAALVGVGFNIKMLQAFLPLPALYALYFFGSAQGWGRKVWHLVVATLVLIPVALSWATVVDLTPADQRPYVGSSTTNSVYNLIFGYNGLQRLEGRTAGSAANTTVQANAAVVPATTDAASTAAVDGTAATDGTRPEGGPNGGSGNMFGTGSAGPLRLFQSGLAAQVSWLLPFGLVSLVGMALSAGWRKPTTNLHRGLILWGGWLITCVVFFSVAGFFHQYYLAMLGAPLAAVVGMGVMWLWHMRSAHPVRAALVLMATAAVTLGFQLYAVALYDTLGWWVALPAALAVLGLALLGVSLRRRSHWLPRLSYALLIGGLLVVPAVWSGLTTAYANTSSSLTQAYSGNTRSGMAFGGMERPAGSTSDAAAPSAGGMGGGVSDALIAYLQANTQDTTYLVVVPSSGTGSELVLATGRPVLYAGGFSGSDPVLDGDGLAQLVAAGEVKYVLWGGGMGGGGNSTTSASITAYLTEHGTVVSSAELGTAATATSTSGRGGPNGQLTLYRVE